MKYIMRFVLFVAIVAAVVVVPLIIWGKKVSTVIGDLNSSILMLLELFGLILAFILICFVFYQFIRYYFSPQFVFEGFSNDGDLLADAQKPLQFNKLAWEEFANQFHILLQQWGQYANSSVNNLSAKADPDMPRNTFLEKIFPPLNEENFIGSIGTTIFDRVKLVEGKGPEKFSVLMSTLSFISAIIPPPVIRISGHLQRQGKTPDKVGITLEFIDNKKPYNIAIHSFWEDEMVSGQLSSEPEVPLQQRYMKLLCPAMRWLILECYRQKEEARISRINFGFFMGRRKGSKTKHAEAAWLLYNLGTLYYASVDDFKTQITEKGFFIQNAIRHLLQASNTKPRWYLPYLYRANIHGFEMMFAKSASPERNKLLQKALDLYDLALDCKDTKVGQESVENRHRVILAKALTELNSDIDALIIKANLELEDMKKKQDPANFDWKRPDCAIYLYDLATWYALAPRDIIPNARQEARRYLAYSLIRSQSLWDQAEGDPNFGKMLFGRYLEVLKDELGKKLREKPDLPESPGEVIKAETETILREVDHRLKRGSAS